MGSTGRSARLRRRGLLTVVIFAVPLAAAEATAQPGAAPPPATATAPAPPPSASAPPSATAPPAPPAPPAATAPPSATAPPVYGPPPYGAPPPGYGYPPYGAPPGYGYPPPYGTAPGYAPQPAPEPPPPPIPKKPEPPPKWIIRLNVGLAFPAPSEEKDLLEDEEGYGLGPAFLLGADFSWLFAEHLGLGAFGVWTNSSDKPKNGGPQLVANDYFIGGELSLTFGTPDVRMLFTPRLGVGFGTLELGGPANTQSAFAWGAEISVLFPHAHVGISTGFLRASVGPPGELGRDYDLGATYLAFTGTFDG